MFWSITAFYAGELLTLVLSITALRILSSSISAYQVSVRPIRLQQNFLSTWFKIEGQVVEHWERHLRTSCSQCHSHLDPTTEPGMSSQHTRHALETEEEWKMAAHAETCRAVGVLFVPLVMEFRVVGVMKPSTPLPALAVSRDGVLVFPHQRYDTYLFQRLAISLWQMHTVDPPPASPFCQRGLADLTDLVTSLFIYFLFILFIYLFFLCSASLLNARNAEL